jgi:hypothetical protein
MVWCAAGTTAGIAPLTGWTNRQEQDIGPAVLGYYTYDTVDDVDVTWGANLNAENELSMLGVAVSEVAGGGGSTVPVKMYDYRRRRVA